MLNKHEPEETALCPWCDAQIFRVGICLINGSPLETCNAWRCDYCDAYLDCLGLPIGFEKIVFDIPGVSHCHFREE